MRASLAQLSGVTSLWFSQEIKGVARFFSNRDGEACKETTGEKALVKTAYTRAGGELTGRGIMSWNNRQDEGNVIAMNKRDEVVWHTLDCLPSLLGTEVVGTIDWDFRYRMMRIVEIVGLDLQADGPFGSAHPVHWKLTFHLQLCHDWRQAAHPSYHYSSTAL